MSERSERWTRADPGSVDYPPALYPLLGPEAPATLSLRGEPRLLRTGLTALFCSVRVAPELVLPTYDLARALRETAVPVIGGFQSPMERECLEYLLRGRHPVVVAPARAVGGMRLAPAWRDALEGGTMLIVSPFDTAKRPTNALATRRNRMVAAIADRILLAYASPGGRLFRLAQEALAWGKPVFCLEHPANRDLLLMGARPLEVVRQPHAVDALPAVRLAPRPSLP